MRRLFAIACLLLSPALAMAAPNSSSDIYTPSQLGVSNVLLSSAPSFTVGVRRYNALTVHITLTYAAATSITLNCSAGNYANYQAPIGFRTVNADGSITMGDVKGWTYPTGSVSRGFRIIVGDLNDATLTCTVTGAGATTDRISVAAYGGGA